MLTNIIKSESRIRVKILPLILLTIYNNMPLKPSFNTN